MTQDDTPTTQPPHDLEAEALVLRAMLRSTEAISDVVELLHPDDFYRHAHGRIYLAILEVYARDEDPAMRSVADQLAKHDDIADVGGHVYLQRLAGTPTAKDSWVKAASTVQGMAVLRRMMVAAARIDDLTTDVTAETVDRVLDTAEAEIFAATNRSRSRIPQSHPLADVMEGALDEIEAIGSHPGETAGIPTGFSDLDLLTGGLYPGQLIVVAGRPSMGTSTLALNLLRSAAIKHNLPAAFFALESRRTDLTMRLLAAEARVALHHMRSGTITDDGLDPPRQTHARGLRRPALPPGQLLRQLHRAPRALPTLAPPARPEAHRGRRPAVAQLRHPPSRIPLPRGLRDRPQSEEPGQGA